MPGLTASDSSVADLLAGAARIESVADRRSAAQVVLEKLVHLIATGVLQPGDSLPGERELSAAFEVSRETVRSAIRLLAGRGVLEIAHGARTRITDANVHDLVAGSGLREVNRYPLDEVSSARQLIELAVVALAAERIGAADLRLLSLSIDQQRQTDGDPVRYLILDREFHQTIYRACGNAVLSDSATALYSYMMGYRRQVMGTAGAIGQSIAEHQAILDGLRAHDPDAARAAFSRHLERIHSSTAALLRRLVRAEVRGSGRTRRKGKA